MNSDCPEGKGGVNINPSARRSIHSYRNNKLRTDEIMGRYGLNKTNNQNERDVNDQGKDVVDNVMSKMSRQTSPLSIRKKKIARTNSYSQDEENTDDINTNVLSKSLPATLPSHLPYSDDSDIEENYSVTSLTKSRTEDESYHGMINKSSERLQQSPYQRKSSVSSRDKSRSQSSNTTRNILLTLVLGITAVMVHWMFPNIITYNSQDKSTQTVNHDKIIFENNMKNLQEKYNIDDNSILKLKSGISTIFSRMDTGSFMFVYNSKTNNFNAVRFGKFADEVAYTAARYLRNNISPIQHPVVESSNLDMQEHGELITRYRDDVDRSGVMLVKEIDGVPSDLAMAFHYYCDEYDPLVKRSAIFFTLNMANCSNTSASDTDILVGVLAHALQLKPDIWLLSGGLSRAKDPNAINCTQLSKTLGETLCLSLPAFHAYTGCDYTAAFHNKDPKTTHDFIEKCLARKWKTVPPENMRPLLTRVVDVIIDVTSVF